MRHALDNASLADNRKMREMTDEESEAVRKCILARDVFAKLRKSVAEIYSDNPTPDNTGAFNENQVDESFDDNEW